MYRLRHVSPNSLMFSSLIELMNCWKYKVPTFYWCSKTLKTYLGVLFCRYTMHVLLKLQVHMLLFKMFALWCLNGTAKCGRKGCGFSHAHFGNRENKSLIDKMSPKNVFPMRGIEPRPPRWERGILTTRPHGKLFVSLATWRHVPLTLCQGNYYQLMAVKRMCMFLRKWLCFWPCVKWKPKYDSKM